MSDDNASELKAHDKVRENMVLNEAVDLMYKSVIKSKSAANEVEEAFILFSNTSWFNIINKCRVITILMRAIFRCTNAQYHATKMTAHCAAIINNTIGKGFNEEALKK